MKVLLVTPSFFGYETAIAQAFKGAGHEVDLFDERPSNSPLARALVRVAPLIMRRRVERHYDRLTRRIMGTKYELMLVVKGEVVPREFIAEFRRLNPAATVVFYTFDSLANSPQALRLVDLFDYRYTFDRQDAERVQGFRYKPLFYTTDYAPSGRPRQLDVSFIGTLHGDRYEFTQAVSSAVSAERRVLFYYVPALWFFWLRKLTSRDVRPVRRAEVSARALSPSQVIEIVQQSRTVIDIQRRGQTGLTMRTFEVLATGAALITSNEAIADEDFYDEARILVVPRDASLIDPAVVDAFVQAQPEIATAPAGFEAHSIDAWIAEFVSLRRSRGGAS